MITYNNPKDTERRSNVDPLSLEKMQILEKAINRLVKFANDDEGVDLLKGHSDDEIIGIFQRLLDHHANLQHFYDNAGGWEGLAKLQETADSKGWISVDERLPEDGQDCIIFAREQVADNATFYNDTNNFYIHNVGTIEVSEVTHWQPLPEPPTE